MADLAELSSLLQKSDYLDIAEILREGDTDKVEDASDRNTSSGSASGSGKRKRSSQNSQNSLHRTDRLYGAATAIEQSDIIEEEELARKRRANANAALTQPQSQSQSQSQSQTQRSKK